MRVKWQEADTKGMLWGMGYKALDQKHFLSSFVHLFNKNIVIPPGGSLILPNP